MKNILLVVTLLTTALVVKAQSVNLAQSVLLNGSGPVAITPEGDPVNPNVVFVVTQHGGVNGYGSIVKYTVSTNTSVLLYSFEGGLDGAYPYSGLVKLGLFFYGTTYSAGTNNFGTIYKMTATGTVTPLYSFTGGADGSYPIGGLAVGPGPEQTLYGTTLQNGTGFGAGGTIYKYVPRIATLSVLHTFNFSSAPQNGYYPQTTIVKDNANRNLFYGTCSGGGTNAGWGTLWSINSTGKFKLLHKFTNNSTVKEGGVPLGAVVQAPAGGNLFGVTETSGQYGDGTVYTYNLNANTLSVLYPVQETRGYANGGGNATLIISQYGTLPDNLGIYGVIPFNGIYSEGILFGMNLDGSNFQDLYDFNPASGVYAPNTALLSNPVVGGLSSFTGISDGGSGAVFTLEW